MSLTRFAIDNPVIVAALTAVVVAAGIIGALRLGIVFLPDITAPKVSIDAAYRGASPAEMEQLVVKPLEDHVTGVHNQDTMQSTVQEGQAKIELSFVLGTDIDAALTDVQHRVDAARLYLPPDLDPPTVTKQSIAAAPIVIEGLSSTQLSVQQLSDLVTTQVDPALRAVRGVENVTYDGALPAEFHVYPDPRRLAAVGAALPDIVSLLANDNVTYPGGRVTAGTETSVAVRSDVVDAAGLAVLPLQTAAAGLVRIGDVAVTEAGHVEARIITRVDGVPSVIIHVARGQGTDEVRTTDLVRQAFADLAIAHPDVRFREISASADLTAATVSGVGESLVEGVILTACVLMLTLHAWRSALVVMVAIPTSLLATLTVMWMLGYTLDLTSTMGLSLAIGILVDDSIVVLENIHHHFAAGENRRDAAIRGRTEIGAAAIAITLVDVVVYLPIGFASGIVGRVLREFGVVVGFATLVSLLISFTLTPLLAARWSLRGKDRWEAVLGRLTKSSRIVSDWYERHALPWVLEHPISVIVLCSALVFAAVTLVALGFVGGEVLPPSPSGSVTATVTYPSGTPIERTDAGLQRLDRAIRYGLPVGAVVTTTGTQPDDPSPTQGGNVGTLTVQVPATGPQGVDAIVEAVRGLANVVPGARLLVSADQNTGSSRGAVAYAVTGTLDQDVDRAANRVADAMRAARGTVDVVTSTGQRTAQVIVRIDPLRCKMLDVSPANAALTARAATGGVLATRVRTATALVDVIVQAPPSLRTSIDDIARTPVRTSHGAFVRLADVAQLQATTVQTKIDRIDRRRIASVTASLEPGATVGGVMSAVDARLSSPGYLPANTRLVTFGGSKLFKDTVSGFAPVLGLSLFGMYILMVILFGSFTTPLVVMCTLPVSLVGALGSLALAHQSLNVFSVISILLLFGLAAKNGILLVDYARREVASGVERVDAMRDAAARRFRPIVMTTSAMILSSLPLALGFAQGASFRQSMGTVLIGGLVSSLVLTLALIPAIYVAAPIRKRLRAHANAAPQLVAQRTTP